MNKNRVTTFENARVGDEVESLKYGKGIVSRIDTTDDTIHVQFKGEEEFGCWYDRRTGVDYEEDERTLYWPGSIKIDPQLEPVRKVVKEYVSFCIIDNSGDVFYGPAPAWRANKYMKEQNQGQFRLVKMTGTAEVEEE
jgi:hypothetical protein